MPKAPVIFWFRQDLRLADNPGLTAAVRAGAVLPVYILDDENAGKWRMGAASRWWLEQALVRLNDSLDGALRCFVGAADQILPELVRQSGAAEVFWNRCYEPWRISRDKKLKQRLTEQGIKVHSYNAALLWEPWEILKKDGTPYQVFTPYFRKGCLSVPPPKPLPPPESAEFTSGNLDALPLPRLEPLLPQPWHGKLASRWSVGEQQAGDALADFLHNRLKGYKQGRDYLADDHVSRLSPHLHFGEISPRQVWHDALRRGIELGCEQDLDHFLSELAWREFSHYLLYYFPQLPEHCFNAKFESFPWQRDTMAFEAWKWGETGYPLVDAGMRELWETGIMHNRARMITASFLVKNQLVDWRLGQDWFWDCLVDADLASNSFGWQWVAGSGADAVPYFRIFNPVTQGKKFDPDGRYVRRYVPELRRLPDRYLHAPWEAPAEVLATAGITLGRDYPQPVVDLKISREKALAAFHSLKKV